MSLATIPGSSCASATLLIRFLRDELAAAAAASLQAHVDSCAVCQEELEKLVGATTNPLAAADSRPGADKQDTIPSAPAPRHQPDELAHIPGYEVLGVLGRGGMGVVYQARQQRPGRVVALKVLVGGRHASPKERERFLREAGAVAQLQHPYIVSLH